MCGADERPREELPVEAQVALAMQHEKLLAIVTNEAHRRRDFVPLGSPRIHLALQR